MSRNFLPAVLAIGVGVFTGYYTFQPTFQQLAIEKAQSGQPASLAPPKSETKVSAEENAAKSPTNDSKSTTDSKPKVDNSR